MRLKFRTFGTGRPTSPPPPGGGRAKMTDFWQTAYRHLSSACLISIALCHLHGGISQISLVCIHSKECSRLFSYLCDGCYVGERGEGGGGHLAKSFLDHIFHVVGGGGGRGKGNGCQRKKIYALESRPIPPYTIFLDFVGRLWWIFALSFWNILLQFKKPFLTLQLQ
jgi:hypothetical protein